MYYNYLFSDCQKYYYGVNCDKTCYGCSHGDCNAVGICNQGCKPSFSGDRCDSKYRIISIFFVRPNYI